MSRNAIIVTIACCAGFAHADIISQDASTFDFSGTQSIGFEGFKPGSTVQSLDFGGLPATVSFSGRSPLSNNIFQTTDGFGAIAHEGDNFWKVRADHMRIDFGDERLTEFGFFYSDLEWSDLRITFGNAGSFLLSDDNSNETDFFAFKADHNEAFGFVTFEWTDDTDGVGFDNMFVKSVPAPGAFALLAGSGVVLTIRRRR